MNGFSRYAGSVRVHLGRWRDTSERPGNTSLVFEIARSGPSVHSRQVGERELRTVRMERYQNDIERDARVMERDQKVIERHEKVIELHEKVIERHEKVIELHQKVIERHQNDIELHEKVIGRHQNDIELHGFL